jgi:hypothetical protein
LSEVRECNQFCVKGEADFRKFKIMDNGAILSDQAATSFESWRSGTNNQVPDCLFRFDCNSFNVVRLYFTRCDLSRNIQKVVYGLPFNLVSSGVSGWNASTLKTVYTLTSSELCGYLTAIYKESFYGLMHMFENVGSDDADLKIVPSQAMRLGAIITISGL